MIDVYEYCVWAIKAPPEARIAVEIMVAKYLLG